MKNQKSMMRQSAACYAENFQLPVFPCRGKRPATEHGSKDASTDRDRINSWWASEEHNVAIATGNGLVALDVDVDHGAGKFGDETLSNLEAQYGPLPDTWTCLTGGGGVHYYFRCEDPALTVRTNFDASLDYRGNGGYVIAPPSIHPKSGKAYGWEVNHSPNNTELADLPEWLHRLMLGKGERGSKAQPEGSLEKIPEGRRNDTLFRLAISMRKNGLTGEEILPALLEANEKRCVPPLEKREVETICRSVNKYEAELAAVYHGKFEPEDFSDAGNAEVFFQVYRNDLIWVDALGWLCWNGSQWIRDEHKAVAWSIELTEKMLQEAQEKFFAAHARLAETTVQFEETKAAEDEAAVDAARRELAQARKFLHHARNTRGAARLKNMRELSKPYLVVKADRLDADPFALNTPGGIVDLRTGEIHPHEPSAYCSQMTLVSPDSRGEAQWNAFLETITGGDQSIQQFFQRVAGMSLIGEVYQEGILLAYGGGRNGKSTYFNALGAVLGDYAGNVNIKVLTTDQMNKGASLATLRGKRLVISGEMDPHQSLSISTLKQIASTDELVIEEKFKQPETIKPTHTLALFTNHLPRIDAMDMGTWRRITVVPFQATIPEETEIPNYANVLVKESGGAILSWAIAGAKQFVNDGFRLNLPEAVKKATEAYRQKEDWLMEFIQDQCVVSADARVGAQELYQAYQTWAANAERPACTTGTFSQAMKNAGFLKIHPKNKKWWVGVDLRPEASPEATAIEPE